LNNETELDDPLELSIQERMILQLKTYSKQMILTGIMTIVIFALGVCGIALVPDIIEPVEGFHNVFFIIFGCIMLGSGACIAWILINGRKEYKESESINREYTHQNYLLALSVYGREGDADLDFYEIARDVFPELKKADIESVKETGEVLEVEELTLEDKKQGDYTFDIVANTENGKFIIKDFKKMASYDALKTLLNVVNRETSNILRLVCLAENFDSDILKKYEKLMESYSLPGLQITTDLILVNAKGFSALKISDETV